MSKENLENAAELLVAACVYELPRRLVYLCEEYMIRHMDDENAVDWTHIAIQHNVERLKEEGLQFIEEKIRDRNQEVFTRVHNNPTINSTLLLRQFQG